MNIAYMNLRGSGIDWLQQDYYDLHIAPLKKKLESAERSELFYKTKASGKETKYERIEPSEVKHIPITQFITTQPKHMDGLDYYPCIFHTEKTPSMAVYKDNHFHCYGCGAHGDVIAFVQKLQGTTFVETLKLLKQCS